MNVDVFQYKLLVIPSTQDNHKSLYVVLGLPNVLKCGKNIGDCESHMHNPPGSWKASHESQPCFYYRKQDQATYEHALSNTHWTRT
jgi:hypothetical protein